jgi:nucleotide-binding universal stress UspA family protein
MPNPKTQTNTLLFGRETNTMQTSKSTMQTPKSSTPPFDKVLVATDLTAGSGAAFQVALNMCSDLGAKLSVLHVFEYGVGSAETGESLLESMGAHVKAQQSLDDLINRARQLGVPCETVTENGVVSLAILDTIESKEINLAILGTNALHGFERFVSGSTAETVLRKAPCPVLIVGPRVGNVAVKIEGPIVFASDFNLSTIDAIRYASSLSQLMGSALHCLHVLPRTAEGVERSHVIPQIMTEALQQVVTDCGTKVRLPICVTAYGNEISDSIVDYARQARAKLIVLGVRRASMMASHVPARLAYQIITDAPCPVMTIAF